MCVQNFIEIPAGVWISIGPPRTNRQTIFIVMGPGQKFLILVIGRVKFLLLGSGQPSLVWVWKISTKNSKFSNFLLLLDKEISVSQVKKYPSESRVSFFFIVG